MISYGAGELDQIIQVKSPVKTPDNEGGFVVTWSALRKEWAKVKDSTAKESEEDGQVKTLQNSVFVIRKLPGVSETDVIEYAGYDWNIISIVPNTTRSAMLEILAERGVAL